MDQAIERYGWTTPSAHDLKVLKEQIGREPKAILAVARRCHYGKPIVVVNDPAPPTGSGASVDLFPTLFWLTCPYLSRATGALEAEGWVGRLRERQLADAEWTEGMARVHRRQGELRLGLADPRRLERLKEEAPAKWDVLATSGVGGMRSGGGVKCLHAHLADYLARTTPETSGMSDEPVNLVGRETAHLLLTRGIDLLGSPGCAACRGSSLAGERVASVDIGSNSVRMWVGEMGHPPKEVRRALRTTRLGAGVAREGRLGDEAIGATVEALKGYAQEVRAAGAAVATGAATSAVRDAENGGELLIRVWEEAGLSVPSITGEREAELTFLGALHALPRALKDVGSRELVAVIDVGGGSTELVVGTLRGEILERTSVAVGAVRLTERYIEGEAVEPEALEALRAHVEREAGSMRSQAVSHAAHVVAVGGTATTLASLAQGLARYEPERVHGFALERSELERLFERLIGLPLPERRALPGLPPERADIIVAGTAILLGMLQAMGAQRFTVSDADLLQGLAWQLAGEPASKEGR